MKKTSTNKADQDISVLKREQLGKAVRGKYFQQYAQIRFGGAKMANAQQARKKSISATSAEDARVLEALKQASKEAKRVADANKLPFIAGKKQSWSVPK